MEVVHKATAQAAGSNPFVFVMSDASVDRMGDVIDPNGWSLASFKRNPVALFGHSSALPVGVWKNVRIEGDALLGELEFLPEGRSPRVDEIRAFVETGMLRAVSVGFRPLASEAIPNSKAGGVRYTQAELLECSVVSIPANPNALAVAKGLHISDDVQRLIFGESAGEISSTVRRGMPGETAATSRPPRISKMKTLSERIVDAQNDLVQLKDKLTEHVKADDADEFVTDELSGQIEQKTTALGALKRAETALAGIAAKSDGERDQRRVFPTVARKTEPKDLLIRSAVVQVLSHLEKRSMQDVLVGRYGEDDTIKAMLSVVTRAASAPAQTNVTGWAAELVQTSVLDFIDALMPISVYPTLRDKGGRFTFGQNGIVSIPSRSATPSIAGSFVAQGSPIPVRQGAFTSTTLTPKKMSVITTFTREMAIHSTPAIEGILRQAVQEDTAVSLDSVLLDAVAASSVRPAGLRNAVTGLTPTTGGGLLALTTDLKGLAGALIVTSNGNLRAPTWIMNPVQALSISMQQTANGEFPFAADLERGTLLGYPVIKSATVPLATVLFVDAADFFSATGDDPRFDVSDQATLHMEDTTPLAIGTVGTPNTVAAPIRSMFQTDSIALRMILDVNWSMRRAGMVAFVASVTW